MLDGYHRRQAYLKYNETHAERLAALKEDETIPPPFDTIPCEYHQVQKAFPSSCMPNGDKKATAREVYIDNLASPSKRSLPSVESRKNGQEIRSKTYWRAFQDTKRAVMIKLDMLGWTQKK